MFFPPQSTKPPIKKRGHAGHPGQGPIGQTCGSCQHRKSVQGGQKTFSKCDLNRRNWTYGPASDIRKKDPACQFWAAIEATP